MKNIPVLIELNPSNGTTVNWVVNAGVFGKLDHWLRENKRFTYPIMSLVMFSAFAAASTPWVKNYHTFKEIESVSNSLTSFQALYRSYGDGSLHTSPQTPLSPVDELIDSIEAKMVMLDIDQKKLQQAKLLWKDGYYLAGSSKEVLIKTVSFDACNKINKQPVKIQSLIQSLKNSHVSGSFYEVNCYLQPWGSQPKAPFVDESFVTDGTWVTPVAYIVIKDPAKTKRRAQNQSMKSSFL